MTAALPLTRPDIEQALDAAAMDWSQIDPSIMGTLFERGLDPDKRSQLGAHYTDAEKIMKIIEPVIQRPLEAEWAETRAEIEVFLAKGAHERVVRRAHQGAERRREALQGLPRPPARLPRARPGLRLRQFSLSRAAGAEGPRASRRHRGRGSGPPAGVSPASGRSSFSVSRSTRTPPSWPGCRSGSARSSGCSATASVSPGTRSSARSTRSNAATRS